MNAVLAERVAALEAERAIPTPRLSKPTVPEPVTEQQAAANRAALLAALRKTT